MLYKTIVLELLKQRPMLHETLRKKRMVLRQVNRLSRELKTSHEAWMEQLSRTRPGSTPSQIASEAEEMALQELLEALPPESPPDEDETFSHDEAMAFVRNHTLPG
jgi:hypothetical protein